MNFLLPVSQVAFFLHPLVSKPTSVVCFDITRHQYGSRLFPSAHTEHPGALLSVFSDIFVFGLGRSDAFAATAFVNTIDTNHLQVISQGRKLKSLISPEAAG